MSTVSIQPATLDLKLYAGDGFSMLVRFVDSVSGDPWPTTGEWLAQVRAPAMFDSLLASFAVANDEALGEVQLSLTGVQTRAMFGRGDAVWDLQQTIPGSEPRTWYRGSVRTNGDVTP